MSRCCTRRWPIAIGLVIACAFATDESRADCVGCFDVVRVRLELKEAGAREGYFVQYGSIDTLYTDADGTEAISLEYRASEPNFHKKIVFLRAVYQFEGITTATTLADMDSIALSDISRLVYLGRTGFGAFGDINVYDTATIAMLRNPPLARYEDVYTPQRILLSFNREVSESDLHALQDVSDWQYQFASRQQSFFEMCARQLDDGSLSVKDVDRILEDEMSLNHARIFSLDSLRHSGPIGDFLRTIAQRLQVRYDLMSELRTYAGSDGRSESVASANRLIDSMECGGSATPASKGNSTRMELSSILRCIVACDRIWRDIDGDSRDFRKRARVVEVINDSD